MHLKTTIFSARCLCLVDSLITLRAETPGVKLIGVLSVHCIKKIFYEKPTVYKFKSMTMCFNI